MTLLPKMHYRLTRHTTGSSVTFTTDDPDTAAHLFNRTILLVQKAFASSDCPALIDGMVPEVLTDATLKRIQALEEMLEKMCAFLEEHAPDKVYATSSRTDIVQKAEELLGE